MSLLFPLDYDFGDFKFIWFTFSTGFFFLQPQEKVRHNNPSNCWIWVFQWHYYKVYYKPTEAGDIFLSISHKLPLRPAQPVQKSLPCFGSLSRPADIFTLNDLQNP